MTRISLKEQYDRMTKICIINSTHVHIYSTLTLFAIISLITAGSVGSSFAEISVNVDEEHMIALIGTGIDPDNDTLTFFWKQTSGETVDLSANNVAEPQFLAPSVANGQTKVLGFSLTVSDPYGGTTQESIQVIVHPINHDPTVNAGRDRITFPSVNALTIFANGHDIDGDLLSYSWKQLAGQTLELENMNSKHLTINAVQLDFNDFTPLTFEVTVDDGYGGTDTDTVDLFLSIFSSDNPSLAVDAGPIQVVDEGTQVMLHGNGKEINNQPISFTWKQHLGPAVQLSSTIVTTPTFIAPNIAGEEPLVLSFVLTGYSPGSGYAQDTAIVKVMPVNNPPRADAGLDQTVRELSRVKLVGTASDPDGDRITTSWSQTAGPEVRYNEFLTELSFTAPNIATGETANLEFELSVRDSHGLITTDSAKVTVNTVNNPPRADAGLDKKVQEGISVTLFGMGFDADSDPLTYSWSQTGGPRVEISKSGESSISFVSPPGIPNKLPTLTFELQVSDSHGGSDRDSVNVMVVAANNGPSANAGPDRTVDENTSSILKCSGNDPDGDILFYSWKQISGPAVVLNGANTSTLQFVAPSVVKTTGLEFECTVTDGKLSSADTVVVSVMNVLTLDIVADAGDDRIVNEKRLISLDGCESHDPENQVLTYTWSQLSGETVSLSNVNSITPSFMSPTVKNGEIKVLEFKLIVSMMITNAWIQTL